MRMRGLLVCLLAIGCVSRPSTTPPRQRTGSLEAWVVDDKGPVAGATVRLVALEPGTCPCKPVVLEYLGNEVPECRCPEALAAWRARFARCMSPATALFEARTDERGRITLPLEHAMRGTTVIEASSPTGLRWLVPPRTNDAIAIELGERSMPRIRMTVDNPDAVRGAFLFEDGHCVPIRRVGDAWTTIAPVSRNEEDWPVFVVEAPDYVPIVQSWYQGADEIEVTMHRATPLTGTCEGNIVRLENPLQQLVARVAANHMFALTGQIAMSSTVTCWKHGEEVESWDWEPGYGLQEGGLTYSASMSSGTCHLVRVVDASNFAIEDAHVMHYEPSSHSHGSFGGPINTTGGNTDESGNVCLEDIYPGGKLVVHPPVDRGGQCAGEAQLELTQHHQNATTPITVRLNYQRLQRVKYRGRVLSPERTPVAGAHVSTRELHPRDAPSCSESGGAEAITAADGTFELSALPRGKAQLHISHDWFTEQTVNVNLEGERREFVLGRGGTWVGKVLDPEGKIVDKCQVWLTLPSSRILSAECSATGFALSTLEPGTAEVKVRVEKHELGTYRTLVRKMKLEADKLHTMNLAFEKGEHIAGQVVDTYGSPIPGTRLTALPKGQRSPQNQFHNDEVMLEADARGRFVFRHLKPGKWTITTRTGGSATHDIATGNVDVKFVVPIAKPKWP